MRSSRTSGRSPRRSRPGCGRRGSTSSSRSTARTASISAASFRPDVVILDLMLPGLDGLEVCRRIQRDRHVPVLMLTARDSESDIEVGLGVGADDYMVKPFSPRELVARIRALLRRVDRSSTTGIPSAIRIGSLAIDPSTRTVDLDGDAHPPHPHRVRPAPQARRDAARRLRAQAAPRGRLGLPRRAPASARSTRTSGRSAGSCGQT